MKTDRITLEVLNNHFRAIAEAMGCVLERTAFTTYIKETNDFTTGLVTPEGEHFAYPKRIGAYGYVGLDFRTTLQAVGPLSPQDVVIATDPYATGGMATHLPDIHLLKPIFADGRLLCLAWCFIHCSDVGGIAPGSILPGASEIYQEGIRLPPKMLYRGGVLNKPLRDLFLANCRIPEKNWGDIQAQVAALNTAEHRVQALCQKLGAETVRQAIYDVIDYAEQRSRTVIAAIPDGSYQFVDYLEDDVVSDIPIRLAVRLTIRGDEAHLDFSGSDPQVGAAFNIATGGHKHPFLAHALFNYFYSTDPTFPVNAGLIRPVSMTLPPGSIVNGQPPAACGVRYATVQRAHSALQGALLKAIPGRIPADGAGQATILAVSLLDGKSGRRHVTVVQPMIGGSGARSNRDGVDGCDFSLGSLKNTPVESLEAEVPIVVRRYEAVPDSGGAGTNRGGLGLRLDVQVLHPNTLITARGMERFRFEPWGVAGGRAGSPGRAILNPGAAGQRDVGKLNVLHLEAGETLSITAPGGGGYGPPQNRAPDAVLDDVLDGIVSGDAAEMRYRVAIRNGRVDAERTRALRAASSTAAPSPFDYGRHASAHRRDFEAVEEELLARLERLPLGVRDHAKRRVIKELRSGGPGSYTGTALHRAYATVLRELGLPSQPPDSVPRGALS